MEAGSFNVTCSRKTKALQSYGLPWVSPALSVSGATSGTALALFITLTGLSF